MNGVLTKASADEVKQIKENDRGRRRGRLRGGCGERRRGQKERMREMKVQDLEYKGTITCAFGNHSHVPDTTRQLLVPTVTP